ncbi:MAG: glycosyltransferase family 2 protein [Henriciella sp.]|nr:glycosyltransferase family 2 protein [Henriciella sp.]
MSKLPVTVMVPTFRRPAELARAVGSLYRQTLAARGFAIVIVDNCPDASAASTIEHLQRDCPASITLTALSEPRPGVATARNTGMTAVKTDLVAFLDDDQTAPEDWLEQLLANHERFPASVTFGPVKTALPPDQKRHRAYFEQFFGRETGLPSGYIDTTHGIGNALVDFSTLTNDGEWFDTEMNEIGGEDDILFELVRDQSGRFAWADEAFVWEHPDPQRITLSYTMRRAFSYGQAPITLARMAKSPKYLTMLMWILVGFGKTIWHGAQWIALEMIRHPGRAFQLDATLRGIAKLLWFIPMRFYGVAAAKKTKSTPTQTTDDSIEDKPAKVA